MNKFVFANNMQNDFCILKQFIFANLFFTKLKITKILHYIQISLISMFLIVLSIFIILDKSKYFNHFNHAPQKIIKILVEKISVLYCLRSNLFIT